MQIIKKEKACCIHKTKITKKEQPHNRDLGNSHADKTRFPHSS